MSIRQTPYPKSSFSAYLITLSGISLSIVFILTVFQPFGTANFSHPYKYLLLSGYGMVILLVGALYFGVTSLLISSSKLDRWTVLDEVAFLFVNISLCQIGCFFYWAFWFSDGITWEQFFVFFRLASSVTLIPMSVYLFFIYQKYKEVNFNKAHNNILSL